MPGQVTYRDPNEEPPEGGYVVLLVPERFARASAAAVPSDPSRLKRWLEYMSQLRTAIPDRIERYRGMGRFHLDPFVATHVQPLDRDPSAGTETDRAARRLLADADLDTALIPDLSLAQAARQAADQPGHWEIIRLDAGDHSTGGEVLGFDIGWWPECYSILSDAVVHPMWHPAAPEDFSDLAKLLASTNDSGLFESPDAATRYREYYVSRDWAEHEDSPFVPVRISVVSEHAP